MKLISFLLGFIFFLLGFAYLYRPALVYKFNLLMREYLFNDRLVLVNRRKIGTFLLITGALILFFSL